MNKTLADFLSSLLWPVVVMVVAGVFYSPIRRLLRALSRRVERGDEIKFSTYLTIGKSTGRLSIPASGNLVTDDHLALIHRSWRPTDPEKEATKRNMHQIHVILYGQPAVLDRVEYVLYRLNPVYPNHVQASSDRKLLFGFYELANGYSLIRAEVKIKDQRQIVRLSRFIDLMDRSPELKKEGWGLPNPSELETSTPT